MATVKQVDLTKKGQTLDNVYVDSDYEAVWDTYKDPATKYCRAVMLGMIVANYKMRLSCFRHIRDLQRVIEEDPEFKYYYDLSKVREILTFAEDCPDVDTGKPLPLMPWQMNFLSQVNGWRRKADPNQKRPYALLSVSRTNGKTYLINIYLMYSFLVEGNGLKQQDYLYTAPVSQQVDKGWNYLMMTANNLRSVPTYRKYFVERNILVQELAIRGKRDRSKVTKLSNESGQFDSFHFKIAVFDEAGDPRNTGKNLGKITSGQMQVKGHQFLQVSTAYDNPDVPFRKTQLEITEAMEKDYSRDRDDYLMYVYEQDSLDELDKPETWVKSNPILSLEAKHDSMIDSMVAERDNKKSDGTLQDFITRNLNMWFVDKAKMFLNIEDIEGSVTDEPFDMTGKPCYIGFDYSVSDDDTSVAFVFPYKDDAGKKMYYVYQHSFVPLQAVAGNVQLKEKQDGIAYRAAQVKGFATIASNPYGMVIEDDVLDWLLNFIDAYELDVQFFVYDQYRSNKIIKVLENNTDLNLITLKQDMFHITEPTKITRNAFTEGRIKFGDDPIITSALSHATLEVENNSIRISKARKSAKIDFVAALIDAFSEAYYHFDNFTGHKEKESKSVFGNQSNEQVSDWFKSDNFSF